MLQIPAGKPVDVCSLGSAVKRAFPNAAVSYGPDEQVVYVENVGEASLSILEGIVNNHDASIEQSRTAIKKGDVRPRQSPLFRSIVNLNEREITKQWQKPIRPNGQQI